MSFGGRVSAIDPLGYLDFLALVDGSRLVLTDSGGIQEETSVLGVPCLTLRENTERPVTVSLGTNRVVGTDPVRVRNAAVEALTRSRMPAQIPLWDGATAERIRDVLLSSEDARFLPRRGSTLGGGGGASGQTRSERTPTFVRAWTSQPLAASQSCQLTHCVITEVPPRTITVIGSMTNSPSFVDVFGGTKVGSVRKEWQTEKASRSGASECVREAPPRGDEHRVGV